MDFHSVVVIGAGLSGLTTAYRLAQKGIDVHVYEARQRIGGRIFTVNMNNTQVELGGQNILDGGKAENIQKLISELELKTTQGKIKSKFHYYDGSKLVDINDTLKKSNIIVSEESLLQTLEKLAATSQNMDQILCSLFKGYTELYKVHSLRLMGYEGLSPEKLSPIYVKTLAHMLLNFNTLQKDGHKYIQYIVIQGGTALLAEKLKEKIGNKIRLNHALKSLTKSKSTKNSYTLTYGNGKMIEAKRVVLAIPCSVYKNIHFDLDDAFHSRLQHINDIAYGEHSKLLVPIHNSDKLNGVYINDKFATFSVATPNIATLFYLNNNVSFTPQTIQQIFKRDQSYLELIYQQKIPPHFEARYANHEQFSSYQGPVGYNWFHDPYSQGTYSCIAAGQEECLGSTIIYKGESVKKLFSPIEDRIFFAGEHTSTLMDGMGTMEAAVEAGERTARIMSTD